ncbi:hypothetical protein IT882_04370 [Microbacterium schleiferi]|uniref:Uncharacterized protein n=1 Tax=Microbacterium schleiferi TaxID=69362 RepID=A0A7S8MXY9_9MICO|nr:hypothetical protein [Microbacterium schleiferi]QPE05309.1 hypothetical protein IT882_04370 [Microbacterium schleiferi]
MPIDLGTEQTVTWTTTTSHTVTVTVTRPDGTQLDAVSATETFDTYSATVATPLAGRYLLRWDDTTADVVYTDTIDVWPADPRFLISVDDAMESLQWNTASKADTASRDMVRLYVAAATPIIEDIAGAVLIRTVEQYADGGKTGVLLWDRPSEVLSVEVDGTAITDYVVNKSAAILKRGKYGERFDPGFQVVRILYRTGSEGVAPNLQLATRELVRHLWQVGQQTIEGVPGSYGDRPMGVTPSGFAVPKRVLELASATHSLPGVA